MTARAILLSSALMLMALALALSGCAAPNVTPRRGPAIYYTEAAPTDYDLAPMVRSIDATAYAVRAAPYAAWKEHSDTVARNNTYGWRPDPVRVCGPLYGSGDNYCH